MAQHPNVARIVEGYERFAGRDLDGVLELLSEDVRWHTPSRGRLGGHHCGRAEVAAHLAELYEVTGGTLRLNLLEVFADDRHAVAHLRETATRASDGQVLDAREVHIFHLEDDGLAVEFWDVPEDPDVHAEFFA